jgi:metal-responsive CopG/Arc/MetJ family transcriptional regulator
MARKDWFYIPLPLEQAKALDEIIEKDCIKYGILDRTELIRIIIGEFIERYERTGKSFIKAKKSLRDNNNHNGNNDDNITLMI